jgi:hypothetical protein
MKEVDTDRINVSRILRGISVFLCMSGVFAWLKHKEIYRVYFLCAAAGLISSIFFAAVLRPIYRIAGKILSVVATVGMKIVLFVVFYLLFTPISLFVKLSGVKLLGEGINKEHKSYWKTINKRNHRREDYEHEF